MHQKLGPVLIVGPFTPLGRERLEHLRDTLREFGVPCGLGEDFGGIGVSEGVRKSIRESSMVIGFLERMNKKSSEPSPWVVRELALASALGKNCVPFVEQGVRVSRELLGDLEFIPFRTNNFSSVFPRVCRELRTRLGIKEPFAPWFCVPEDDLDIPCDGDAMAQWERARTLAKHAQRMIEFQHGDEGAARKQLDLALKYAQQAVKLDPNSGQALVTLGGILQESGRLDESHKINVSILKKFKSNHRVCAAAYHNLAVELERRFPYRRTKKLKKEIARLYEHSLRLDPSRAITRAPLICFYLRLQQFQKAYALLEQSVHDETFKTMMREELDRSPDRIALLNALPRLAQNLFYPINLACLEQ